MAVPGVCKDTGYKDNGAGSGNAPDSVNRSDSDNDGSLDSGGTARKRGGNRNCHADNNHHGVSIRIYPVNNVFVSIINNAMVEEDKGEYTVTEPLFNPLRGILWKNNVCKLRAHFRTDDKNIKVLKSLKGVDITPEVPEE